MARFGARRPPAEVARRLPVCGLAVLVVGLLLGLAPASAAAGPPQIGAAWITDVTATSASLNAEVNPEGLATTYRFEYLTETSYLAGGESFAGATTAPSVGEASLGAESIDQPALQHLVGLTPGTAYRYRIVATNSQSPAGGTLGPALIFTTQPSFSGGAEECSNAQLRFEDNSFALPDCRAWEMVSPVDKNGGAVQGFGANAGGGVLQAAADGEAATFSSNASFGQGAEGAPPASQYLSGRGEAGWLTQNITPPTLSGAYGEGDTGVPYQLFATDLARGLMLNGARCGESGPCPRSYSLRESATGTFTASPAEPDLRFAGASPDLRHVVLSTCAKLTADATEQPVCEAGGPNLYEWSGGALRLINRLGNDPLGTPDAHLAAQAGAISSDGSRVYFTESEGGFLYLREGEAGAKLVSDAGSFQTASSDGRFAFLLEGSKLLRYDAETGTDEQLATEVQGVLGVSEDGSHVYYARAGGLFLWDAGTLAEVAAGAAAADPGDYPPTTGTARVTPDGTHLAFLSKAELTGYDNTDQGTGEPDSEVFLYGAGGGGGGTLTCASCNPTGERPLGPSTIPGAIANGDGEAAAEGEIVTQAYKPRDLSDNGSRLFFDSNDLVVPSDGSSAEDVYQWEAGGNGTCQSVGGCLSLISSGAGSETSSFVDASEDGSSVFFLTGDSLIPTDPGSYDLYDARVLGGFPIPTSPIPCDGDACQRVPSPPKDPAPGTLVPGPPNPPVSFARTRCRKGFVRKHGRCVRKAKHHKKRRGGHRGSPR